LGNSIATDNPSVEKKLHIKLLEERIGVSINIRGTNLTLKGGDWEIELAEKILNQLNGLIKKNYPIYLSDVEYAVRILSGDQSADLKKIFLDKVYIASNKKVISPRSINQKHYIDGIRRFDIVFAIGPAGTGKTYLAMAMAVASLVKKEVNRVVLARPAVEAGEHLGFLPGDLYEKVNPYLRPFSSRRV